MMQEAADQVEGGGPNDGKYIWIKNKPGWNTNYHYISTDFGASFALKRDFSSNYSGSYKVNSEGSIVGFPNSVNSASIAAPWSTDSAAILALKTGSAAGSTIRFPKAAIVSKDNTKVFILRGASATGNASEAILLDLPAGSRTGSVISRSTSVPSLAYPAGLAIEGNRETLQHIIVGNSARIKLGVSAGTGYISHDYGMTWTPIENVLSDATSSQLPSGQLRGFAWSDKGDKCLVAYGEYPNTKLYYSKNYGQSFNTLTVPDDMTGSWAWGVHGSEKFGTIYLSGYYGTQGFIYRSQNKGKSWTKVKEFSGGTNPATYMLCNAKGDKLIACFGGDQNIPISYSLDYGDSWLRSSGDLYYPNHSGFGVIECSRDYMSR